MSHSPLTGGALALRGALAAALLLLGLSPGASTAAAQGTGRITGVVVDSATTRPLPEVQLTVIGTRLGATTDAEGRFFIDRVPVGVRSVEARRLGFRAATISNVTVTEGGTANVTIPISAVALALSEVVTTGVVDPTAGTRVPFTVARLSAENLPVPAANAIESVQGKVAGVTVVSSGQPGSGTNILLRSPTSISRSNSPLIIVDGVVQSQAFGGSSADLESLDIESIEIVKGAAASSLYGARAATGVIQIRTRRGGELTPGPTRVNVRSEMGSNSLGNKIQWAQYHYYRTNAKGQYVDANGVVVTRANRVSRPTYEAFQDVPYLDPLYDQVERFFDPGQFYKNSVNLSQNAGRTNWFLSLVNSKEDGVVLNSGKYEQNDVRLNLDHRWRDNLTVSFSGYHSRSLRHELYGDTFFDLINQAPDVDLRTPDPDGTPFLFQGDPEGREENPLYVLATEDNKRRRVRTQGSLEARFAPLSWLNLDANVSYDRSDRRINFFLDKGVKTEGFSLGGPGEIEQFTGTTDAINAAASANVMQSFGALTLRGTLRGVVEREDNMTTTAEGENLSVPGVRSLSNAQTRFVSSVEQDVRSSGFAVSIAGDYAGRYIADALVRRDGSSLFGPEEQWNSYYRVSGAYRISNESWWPFADINELKLRASQGTAGSRPEFADRFETFSFTEGGGLVKQTLGNRFLKPEHAKETELGIDAIVRQRYSLQLSYAHTRVTDQLVAIPLAGFYGFSTQWQNAGILTGNTYEASLEAMVVSRPALQWRVGLIADRSRNKVTEFKRACFSTQTIAFRCVGETLGAMYGYHFLRSPDELDAAAQPRASEFQVNDDGLLVWVGAGNDFRQGETERLWGTNTTIGNTVYNWGQPITLVDSTGSSALVNIGDGNPDYHVGFSNNVSWRSFQLFTLLDAQVGGHAYNQTNQRMYQWGRSGDVDQAGKPQELKKPVTYYVGLYAANNPTDYFVEDAGFLKLREVSLRYRFPQRVIAPLGRVGINAGSAAVIGRNLITWTKYGGYDPEVGGTIVRLDSFDYPRYRTFTGSIEFTF